MKKILSVLLLMVTVLVTLYTLTGCVENDSKKGPNEEITSSSISNGDDKYTTNKVENIATNSATANTNKKESVTSSSTSNNTQDKQESKEYEVNVSKKNIELKVESSSSFEITFTNPDESSIREYITCKDQNDIILVKYSPLENKTITVEVDALKVGVTEIEVCDYNYPNVKQIVTVNVIE